MTPEDMFERFMFEPVDEISRAQLEREMLTNFPGKYTIAFLPDRIGYCMEFASDQEELIWKLKWTGRQDC